MRVLRAISLFCLALLILGAQCQVKCVLMPPATQGSSQTAKQHPPGCPLHKQQAPKQQAPKQQAPVESKQCSHSPQWEYDDVKIVAVLPSTQLPVGFTRVETIADASVPLPPSTRSAPLNLRL